MMENGLARLVAACVLLLWGCGAARGMSWYDAVGALVAGPATSGEAWPGRAGDDAGGDSGRPSERPSGGTGTEHRRTDDAVTRAEAEKFRHTMQAVVAEYDKIGAGVLARQCLDASRIVQIAENPSGWREILFLLAGLVSLLAALFITKILASMFKVEIAQLLWIPIAGCIALLVGLFMAIRAAKKRKVAVAAGVALSAAGVVSLVDPVRHAFFGFVANVFVVFTAWYVPLVAAAVGMAGLLFVFFLLCSHAGDTFKAIGGFLLRNAIGLVAIPGVCAVLFLAILAVVGPWIEGHADALASTWEGEATGGWSESGAVGITLESLGGRVIKEVWESETSSGRPEHHSRESETETPVWNGPWGGGRQGGSGSGGQEPERGGSGGVRPGGAGTVPFGAYPEEVRRTATEIARAAEDVYQGRLPRGAVAFDAFLSAPALESVPVHGWDAATATFTTPAGLVVQAYRRPGGETVVMFRGTASAKDVVEDGRQLFGEGGARQYEEAAALVRAVRQAAEGPLVVAGHSLGGGQAQYALAMNADLGRMRGVGFNPAGLSKLSVDAAEMRMGGSAVSAAGAFAAVRLETDPVSTAGIFLGRVVVVPANGVRGAAAHWISTLVRAMEAASGRSSGRPWSGGGGRKSQGATR